MKENPSESGLSEPLEDCLETILRLAARDRVARARDIALALDIRPPTVTAALRALRDRGLVEYEPYGQIHLTPAGEAQAREITKRHTHLLGFLTDVLAVDPVMANQAACRMEHVVPAEILNRMSDFADFLTRHPDVAKTWRREAQPHKPPVSEGKKKNMMELHRMPFQTPGRVVSIQGDTRSKKRLFELGLVPGASIRVERVAPLGDPLEVRVNKSSFSIRKEDAARVTVEC